MHRRKFIAAMGSFAAAGAAAVGTGAFESAEMERTAEVRVAPDSAGFVEITALNETYATGTADGQLELNFDEESDLGIFDGDAKGLNPNSKYVFDEVFRVANVAGQGDLYVVIEASGFDVENVELTASGEEANALSSGTTLRAADYDDPDETPKLVQPDAVDVDVTIETGDATNSTAGGELTIHAAPGLDRSTFADDV
jgi:hypothetical protein